MSSSPHAMRTTPCIAASSLHTVALATLLLAALTMSAVRSLPAQSSSSTTVSEPAPGDASCTAGDAALASSGWAEAVQDYDICSKLFPQSFAAFSNMGIALSRLGRMQEAIQSYEKAVALDPANARVKFNLAVALVKASDYAGAVERLKQLQRSGDDLRYDELLAFCYFHLESYSLAARAAEKVSASNPGDAGNALILGATYTRMRQYDKALPLITKALQAAGSTEGHLIMAQTLIGLHMYHEAEAELNQIVNVQPDVPGLHTAMGDVYLGTDRTQLAQQEYARAVTQDPNDFEPNYMLGRLARLNGDIPAANQYLNVAQRIQPNSPQVMFEFASIAIGERRYTDAIPLLEKVVKAEPDLAESYLMLASAYQHTGRKQEAQETGEAYSARKKEWLQKQSTHKESLQIGSGASQP